MIGKTFPISFLIFLIGCLGNNMRAFAQQKQPPVLVAATSDSGQPGSVDTARPLQKLWLLNGKGSISVADGKGKVYVKTEAAGMLSFAVGGAAGRHTIFFTDSTGKSIDSLQFFVEANTLIDDGRHYRDMFDMFYRGMASDTGRVTWNNDTYRYFVSWGLDHCHTMKGLKYFLGYGHEFIDLMRLAQREDGMIWSFVQYDDNMDYYRTRDSGTGYTRKIGDKYFIRQPTENHPEYIYVKTIYQCWKASGDDGWMKKNLESAGRALDYTLHDAARWSRRFGLLKRVYTIDSWDFQIDDKYTPDIGLTNSMIIDTAKSKFGVFFGDNTGYVQACHQLAEMLRQAGFNEKAAVYEERAEQINKRLNALSWNGRFYTHFIEEDSTVKRNTGVDEKSQLAQSNAYTLNRILPHDKSKAIIQSYLDLKTKLPPGSPGEWYAIYPPFERGFDIHNKKWQYMNGGVGGHVAGELARGAFEHGYEAYGIDILDRLFALGKKYGNKIWFAYTGSIPPALPAPAYKPVNIAAYANMDSRGAGGDSSFKWMDGTKPGDDLGSLPVGEQVFDRIRFNVIDPEKNSHKAVVAVSRRKKYPEAVEIPLNDTAGAIYLLHTSTKPGSENVAGAVSLRYADGTKVTRYMIMGKHLTYWWFSKLKTDYSGIAWYGSNKVSRGIGLSWCAIDNPFPQKKLSGIILYSPQDDGIYTVLGITLANMPHYVPVNPVSFGGPDNWASATAMAALIEGAAGAKNTPQTKAFDVPFLSPKWAATKIDSINATVEYAASGNYIAYTYLHRRTKNEIELTITGGGERAHVHLLLPKEAKHVKSVTSNDQPLPFKIVRIERSVYADFDIKLLPVKKTVVKY